MINSFVRLRPLAVAGLIFAAMTGAGHSAQAIVYLLDDGSLETVAGLRGGGDSIAINEFPVLAGGNVITSISAAFGTPAFPGNGPAIGTPFTVALWSDYNNDGNPSDAVLLTTATGVVTSVDADTFINVAMTPTRIIGTDFFVGYRISNEDGEFPDALDQDSDQHRSYVAVSDTMGGGDLMNLSANDIPVTSLDNVGIEANWLLRANAVPEPSTYALVGLALLSVLVASRRHNLTASKTSDRL